MRKACNWITINGGILKAWKPLSTLMLAGALLIPGGMASANDTNSGSPDSASVTRELGSGEVLLMTPEEMLAEGIGSASDIQKQEESLSRLTAEQRDSQAEIRDELNGDLATAGVARGEQGDLVVIEDAPVEEGVSTRIWKPACWTSGDYYEVNSRANGGTKLCYANAGSLSFNSGFAFSNDMASIRPGNNRGFVTYFHDGNYYNSITRGPDYGTYSFFGGGTGYYFYGITIY